MCVHSSSTGNFSRDGLPSTVLVISSGTRARSISMFEKMHALGLRIVVVDTPNTWIADLEKSGIIHKLVILPELSTSPQNDELARLVIRGLLDASVGQIHGVHNAYNKYLLLSSLVAHGLGVITNEYRAVEQCVFKNKTRTCLISSGLESWTSFSVTTMGEMEQVADLMQYPAVLKPAKGSGSVGVVRVDSANEALEEFAKLKALPWAKSGTVFILEEYIDGPEFGVELVMEAGNVVFYSIMDAAKQTTGVCFQGIGRSCPSNHSLDVQTSIASHCTFAVKALGLTTGVLDIDLRYSQFGPRVLEINARMGGGSVSTIHQLAYNIDLLEVHLKTLLGIPLEQTVTSIPLDPAVCYEAGWLMSPHSGIVQNVESFSESIKSIFEAHPNVVSIEPLVEDGDSVNGYKGMALPASLIQVVTRATQKHFAEQYLSMVVCTAEERIVDLVPNVAVPSCKLPTIDVQQTLNFFGELGTRREV
jgi:biotin carboxylase